MKCIGIGLCVLISLSCNAMGQLQLKKMEEGVIDDAKLLHKLVWAVLFEDTQKVDRLLSEDEYVHAACNQRLINGKTVLHLAVVPGCNTAQGNTDRMHIARALLRIGLSPDIRDATSRTAVDYLDGYGDFEGKQEMRDLLTGH